MGVKISVWSMSYKINVVADGAIPQLTINGENFSNYAKDFIKDVLGLTKNWVNSNISSEIDGTKYIIEINEDGVTKNICGTEGVSELIALIEKYSNAFSSRLEERDRYFIKNIKKGNWFVKSFTIYPWRNPGYN